MPLSALPGRLAYVVGDSHPWSSGSYAARVHRVACALARAGIEVIVFGRPGLPWDMAPTSDDIEPELRIDGVRHVFLPGSAPPGASRRDRLRHAETALAEAFGIFRPALVLAASDWENAEPALNAARRWGCGFWCEQFGFWERVPGAEHPGFAGTEEAARIRANALRVAQAAQGVLVQSAAMRDELAAAGLPPSRLHMAADGFPAIPPTPPRAERLRQRRALGLGARFVIGHAGALCPEDGADGLLALLDRLVRAGIDAALLLPAPPAMSAPQTALAARIRAEAGRRGLAKRLVFAARPPGDRAAGWMRMADALVLPRRAVPATALAAAPEPWLAAACGVPMVSSDIPPLNRIAGVTGARLCPADDPEALVAALTEIAETPQPEPVFDPDPALRWTARIAPAAAILRAACGAGTARRAADRVPPAPGGFDLRQLPQVALRGVLTPATLAVLGPGRGLPAEARAAGERPIRLTRANILGTLATAAPGLFVIDWAGLQDEPGEWDGLWGSDHMRLNRQVMDACRIALDRGWRVQVIGPVDRARAPLFRTVAGVVEEVAPQEAAR
ncbi:glycosyltransferase [Jhaorihella thermophila]|uniref:Glycosyltransferase involved in cell wall bisynthesis n=1 Tax=Jhaorihella thermophila TaxID=488547 RepID=A0A1H5Y768_9RHOB|nr:glycosyltransferase [Jhaorihella thermophila]SEG19929.1 Glycosyltransferase involved in cell wall bisynthesis [Jhaorihella thermophila]